MEEASFQVDFNKGQRCMGKRNTHTAGVRKGTFAGTRLSLGHIV